MEFVYKIIKIIFLMYGGMLLLLYFFQEKIIFYPQKIPGYILERYKAYELIFSQNGVTLHGWFIKKKNSTNQPMVIYYGGNAEEVSLNLEDMDKMNAGSFLFMNYRGYGQSKGSPTEKHLFADAIQLFDHVVQKENVDSQSIILMGRSLGSGVATHVAANRKVAGVILVTPFDSLVNVGKMHYPVFPVRWLLKHRFDSLSLAPQINTPLLALIAEQDEIIPRHSSFTLLKRWAGKTKYVVIERAGHNDISLHQGYWQAINQFILDRASNTKI